MGPKDIWSISKPYRPSFNSKFPFKNLGGVGAKWAKIRPILTSMNFSKKQRCPVNVVLPLNMHHELSEQKKIAQFYSDEMSKLR